MPRKHKPGDLVTVRVLSVEPGLMRVDLEGTKLRLEMPMKPMSRKRVKAQIEKITATWNRHYGNTFEFRLDKLVES
jgi:hypothetical protein